MMEQERNYTVYMHVNKINNKKYIGLTKDIKRRWSCNGAEYRKQYLGKAIEKYGWENFEHVILYQGLSRNEACQKEIEMISYYNTSDKNLGYNISPGGEDGHNNLWNDEEYRYKQISERKARWQNADYKERHANSMKQAMEKEEYKEKQSKKTKERWKDGYFDYFCKPVICLETGIIYKSLYDASEQTNTCRQDIGLCCNKKQKTANGYHWIFYEGQNFSEYERNLMMQKIGKGHNKQIICVETQKKYNSIKEASIDIGVDNSSIGKALKGKQKTAGGYHWNYCC